MNTVFAFEVTVKDKPDWGMVINARTRGQAKQEYHRHLLDAWPDVPWTALRCRKVGKPMSSDGFIRNANYRSMNDLRCGDEVWVGKNKGVVVGHDYSCNFEVLFDGDSPQYRNLRLSVHPSELCVNAPQTH